MLTLPRPSRPSARQASIRRRALLAAPCLVVAIAIALTGVASGSPTAHAARTCSPPSYPGAGYFTSLNVSGTTCSAGKKVALAYYKCRLKHGKAGRCHSKVLKYACHETRNSIPTEIDARVTCKRGHKKVSLRATGDDVDVSAIARAYGGGGHRRAAGFTTELGNDELIEELRSQVADRLGGGVPSTA